MPVAPFMSIWPLFSVEKRAHRHLLTRKRALKCENETIFISRRKNTKVYRFVYLRIIRTSYHKNMCFLRLWTASSDRYWVCNVSLHDAYTSSIHVFSVWVLTRALLGLVRTLPSAGGGRIGPPIYLGNQQT